MSKKRRTDTNLIRSKTFHTNLRAKRIVVDNLITFFLKQVFDLKKKCFLSNGIRDLAPHCNVIPFVRAAGIPSQIQFRVKTKCYPF